MGVSSAQKWGGGQLRAKKEGGCQFRKERGGGHGREGEVSRLGRKGEGLIQYRNREGQFGEVHFKIQSY